MWRADTSRETALNAVAEGGGKRIRRGSIRNMQSADASFLFPQMSEKLNPPPNSHPNSEGSDKSSTSLFQTAANVCAFRKISALMRQGMSL